MSLYNTIVFTVCTAEQYPFASVLAESLPKNIIFKIGIVQGQVSAKEAISIEELSLPHLAQLRERYNIAALAAVSTPFFADYFLGIEGIENVIYFDPTVQLFGDLTMITQKLGVTDMLLTPRITKKFGKSIYGDEKLFLNTGMYDASFWAIHKTENTLQLLKWWQERLSDRAYFDLCNGMNHAQLWLNYIPIYFQNVLIVKNIGWNVGLQNLHERILTKQKTTWMINLTEPLLFINFREILGKTNTIKTLVSASGSEILLKEYLVKLKKHTAEVPDIFSLHQAITLETPYWKKTLRQKIQQMIDSINHFPLYHSRRE